MISKFSIAVLPFVNMTSDRENEYFSDGITEEIISALSKIKGLHVTARTSSFVFKNKNVDVREIGRQLGVALLLEGSVRKSGNIVRISAQLTKSADGYHVWSDTWDREIKNIFIVQDEIASIIAKKVNEDIQTDFRTDGHVAENTEAVECYLKGNYLLKQWNFEYKDDIISNFRRAIELDNKLINAYMGLSYAYTWLAATGHADPMFSQREIEKCIQHVVELDKNTPDIYINLAGKNFWIEWNFPMALNNLNRALDLQPSNAEALKFKGLVLAAMGHVEQAFDFLFQAERLDPYGDQINSGIGMIYNYTNENTRALEFIEKNERICPYWYAMYLDKVDVLCKMGRFDEVSSLIDTLEKDPNNPLSINQLRSLFYAYQGKREQSVVFLNKLIEEMDGSSMASVANAAFIAQIYILLGENDKALDNLEYGMEHRSTPFLFIRILNYWDPLRSYPRYIEAVKHITFDEEKIIPQKYKKSNITTQQAAEIKKRLNAVMVHEKLYTNPTLTLSDLSELANITNNQLSQVLNEHIGKNFYDFVNQFRLHYFLDLRKNKKYRHYTLLALAYECGFNSKTTFNSFFKKYLGKTPSEYFKAEE